jgi:sugar lactone lactonase YvrE
MYHTDSYEGRIYAYPLAADGTLGEPRVWRQFEGEGAPDGMTVDSEGCLWIAQWGGGRVCRYAPDATLLETVTVAARNPASCTWAGRSAHAVHHHRVRRQHAGTAASAIR